MKEKEDFLKFANSKTSFGHIELKQKIESVFNPLIEKLKTDDKVVVQDGMKRVVPTDILKKYDVIYIPCFGMPHYVLVWKVAEDVLYGVVLSSTQAPHNIHIIEKDRFFKGKFATNSYITHPLSECLKNFVRVYESKIEADTIFKKIKEYYKTHLAL